MGDSTVILPFGGHPAISGRIRTPGDTRVVLLQHGADRSHTPADDSAHHVIPNRQWPTARGMHPLALIILSWLCAVLLDLLLHRLHVSNQLAQHLATGAGLLANLLKWLPIGILAALIPLLQKPCPIYHHWISEPTMLLLWLLSGLLISPLLGMPGEATGFAAGVLLVLPFVKARREGLAAIQPARRRSDAASTRHLPFDARRRNLASIVLGLAFAGTACFVERITAPLTLSLSRLPESPVLQSPHAFVTGSAGVPILSPDTAAGLMPAVLFLAATGLGLAFLLRRPNTGSRRAAAVSAIILWLLFGFLAAYIANHGVSPAEGGLPAFAGTLGYLAQGMFIASPAYVCTISGNLLIVLAGLLTGWSFRGLLPWLSEHRRLRDRTVPASGKVVQLRRRRA